MGFACSATYRKNYSIPSGGLWGRGFKKALGIRLRKLGSFSGSLKRGGCTVAQPQSGGKIKRRRLLSGGGKGGFKKAGTRLKKLWSFNGGGWKGGLYGGKSLYMWVQAWCSGLFRFCLPAGVRLLHLTRECDCEPDQSWLAHWFDLWWEEVRCVGRCIGIPKAKFLRKKRTCRDED